MAKAVRTEKDELLRNYLRKTTVEILGWDQVWFREDVTRKHPIKTQLGFDQRQRGDPLLKFMAEKYDIHLNTFTDFGFLGQHESYLKLDEILKNVDPYVLLCIFTIAQSTKSTVVALALLNEVISLQDAIIVSRLEEMYQQKFFGVVEGAHDYDEARTIGDVASAKWFLNLLQ